MIRRLLPAVTLIAVAVPAGASAKMVRGTVVDRGHRGHQFTVSDCASGSTTTMRSARRAPRTGARVRVAVRRRHGHWVAHRIRHSGRGHGACSVEGTITAVDTPARTITIATDDRGTDENQSLTISVPKSFDIGGFAVGDEVELELAAQSDGTLVLRGIDTDDEGEHGDDHGDDGPGHDHGDDHGGDDGGHSGHGGHGGDDE